MSTIDRFDPPGLLDDLTADMAGAWSRWISEGVDSARAGRPNDYDFDGPREQFFNPTKTPIGDDAQSLDITWTAFPKQITDTSVSSTQRWRRADGSRSLQDEYCEWSVERRASDNKITRVTFTCEGPEYWVFLARYRPDHVLRLYRDFISSAVQLDDLYPHGEYDPYNRWNATTELGAMHLIQRNNTLHAEIELAGGASVVREIDGQLLTGEQELIRCGRYGAPGRHSDPHIGAMVNSLTRQKADVTLANPVGLYFGDLLTNALTTPDGSDPAEYWRVLRGTADNPVRTVYEVPADKGFVVGDITIGGQPIAYGGQIADQIRMKLTGVACRFGQSTVAPMTGCLRPATPLHESLEGAPSVSVGAVVAPLFERRR